MLDPVPVRTFGGSPQAEPDPTSRPALWWSRPVSNHQAKDSSNVRSVVSVRPGAADPAVTVR